MAMIKQMIHKAKYSLGFLIKMQIMNAETGNNIEWWKPQERMMNITRNNHFLFSYNAIAIKNREAAAPAFIPLVPYEKEESAPR